jgi:hypothetical protein
MNTISIRYTYNYRHTTHHNYVWTTCSKCINLKTGRVIKQVYNNSCIGYNINGKFVSLTRLRKELEKIPKEICPF